MGILLEVKKLNKYFGGLAAISELDLNVLDSEILGLIGPNGAGKTTLFNVISGFFPPTSGKVLLNGRNITWMKAHEITHLGISRTFQATNLFMRLSVLENVFTGYHLSYKTKIWKRLLRSPSAHEEENRLRQRAMELLEFMGLTSQKEELAVNLPHGHQRILGICMALATHPRLLLLDEPVTGMNATETQSMIDLIRQIREKGVTIVLVEHDMKAVMNLCDRIVVLNYGQKIAEGLPGEIRENKRVIEAYLGRERGK
jgi:branched-chain amino acid transport system ATP-binding protein